MGKLDRKKPLEKEIKRYFGIALLSHTVILQMENPTEKIKINKDRMSDAMKGLRVRIGDDAMKVLEQDVIDIWKTITDNTPVKFETIPSDVFIEQLQQLITPLEFARRFSRPNIPTKAIRYKSDLVGEEYTEAYNLTINIVLRFIEETEKRYGLPSLKSPLVFKKKKVRETKEEIRKRRELKKIKKQKQVDKIAKEKEELKIQKAKDFVAKMNRLKLEKKKMLDYDCVERGDTLIIDVKETIMECDLELVITEEGYDIFYCGDKYLAEMGPLEDIIEAVLEEIDTEYSFDITEAVDVITECANETINKVIIKGSRK